MSGTVTLIVTGKMEEKALAVALNRAFSELSFSTKRLHGMTSVDFARAPTQSVKQDAVKVGCISEASYTEPEMVYDAIAYTPYLSYYISYISW